MRQLFKKLNELISLIDPAIRRYLEEMNRKKVREDEWLTIQQTCDFIHLTPRTLRRRSSAGVIKCVRIGRSPLYSKMELTRYLNQNHKR